MAAVTADTDALGEVSVLVEHDGRLASGQSVSTDTLEARPAPTCARCRTRCAGAASPRRRRPQRLAPPPSSSGAEPPRQLSCLGVA